MQVGHVIEDPFNVHMYLPNSGQEDILIIEGSQAHILKSTLCSYIYIYIYIYVCMSRSKKTSHSKRITVLMYTCIYVWIDGCADVYVYIRMDRWMINTVLISENFWQNNLREDALDRNPGPATALNPSRYAGDELDFDVTTYHEVCISVVLDTFVLYIHSYYVLVCCKSIVTTYSLYIRCT